MYKENKTLGIALMLGLTTVLSACGESTDKLEDQLNLDAQLSFINSLSYMADFHLKKRNISTGYSGLFDNESVVASDVPSKEVSDTYIYRYDVTNNMVNFGVKNSTYADKKEQMTTNLKKGDNLWVIAWESSNERALSVVAKKRNVEANVFNVRLFANGNYDVTVAGNTVLTTEKGKVTDYLKVSSCGDGLTVAAQSIDLCSGNFGASYLLVVDHNGLLVMAEE